MRLLIASFLPLALVSCIGPVEFDDSGPDSGSSLGGCCFYLCEDDAQQGWQYADSSWDCQGIAESACSVGGAALADWEYDPSCSDCDSCNPY